MTLPHVVLEDTAASTPPIVVVPDDAAAVIPLDVPRITPGEVYLVRAEKGERDTVITRYDLDLAAVTGGAVSPTWSDPRAVIEAYKLGGLVDATEGILREIFGDAAKLKPEIEHDPESGTPTLVFRMQVLRPQRELRHDFVGRYVRQVEVPDGAPAPVIMWEYYDALPT